MKTKVEPMVEKWDKVMQESIDATIEYIEFVNKPHDRKSYDEARKKVKEELDTLVALSVQEAKAEERGRARDAWIMAKKYGLCRNADKAKSELTALQHNKIINNDMEYIFFSTLNTKGGK